MKFEIIDYENGNKILKPQSFKNWPVVYIIKEKDNKGIYVGQTNNFLRRLSEHESKNRLSEKCWLISHDEANRSFSLLLESTLIKRMSVDFATKNREGFRLTNKIGEKSKMGEKPEDNFDRKPYFENEIPIIWNSLIEKNIVTIDYDELGVNELFDLSPFTKTTEEQDEVIESVIKNIIDGKNSLIKGLAGTGKSLLLLKIALIIRERDKNINIAIHSGKANKHKIIKNMIESINPKLDNGIHVLKNLAELKNDEKYSEIDIKHLLIDEGQLLWRKSKKNMLVPSHVRMNPNNISDFEDEIDFIRSLDINYSFFYDEFQDVNPDTIDIDKLEKNTEYCKYELTENHRLKTDEDFKEFIDALFEVKNDRKFFINDSYNYDIKCFDSAKELYDYVKIKNMQCNGKARLLASLQTVERKFGDENLRYESDIMNFNKKYGINVFWNKSNNIQNDWVKNSSIDEVGSIYAIHGSTLNYAGVIFGEDLKLVDGKLEVNYDRRKFNSNVGEEDSIKKTLNSYYALLTRGETGLGVYIEDPELRNHFKNLIK